MTTGGEWRRAFRQVAAAGFGDPHNAYAHTMAWFDGALLVGTTRANLQLRGARNPPKLRPWPVPIPDDPYELDLRAQIWRHDPQTGGWERVLRSPLIQRTGGRRVPRDLGYRGMTTVPAHDGQPATLYVTTWSPARGRAPIVLRSHDGRHFEPLPAPTLDRERPVAHRALVGFHGRLYTAPIGQVRGRPNEGGGAVVLETDDPVHTGWRAVCEPGFGDPTNSSIVELTVFDQHLYAGTLNVTHGYQVWRTAAAGPPPYRWTRVLDRGAGRGPLNQVALSMCVFRGALYVGSGIQGGGHDWVHQVGPAPAELVRIRPDGSWDLLVGRARLTPDGFKVPHSDLGAGFGNPFVGYLWRMCVHEGHLYVGTYDWSVLLPFVPWDLLPRRLRGLRDEIWDFVERTAGFDLWRTHDGERWSRVTGSGFGNPYNIGARTLESTPYGLFVGTANPFGPETAVWSPAGWRYAPNDAGGLEIWTSGSRPPDAGDGSPHPAARVGRRSADTAG